jgi:NADPH:quinone reductase-like Zn-dependent oxidoreductase
MKAALFHTHGGPEVVRIEEVPVPEPGPGEVRVRVRAAAMNHLDLWIRRGIGIDTTMPHIGGSDIAGEVDAMGDGVERLGIGDRIVVNPALSCGHCGACVSGEHSMCREFRILGEHTDGGFAEYVVVPFENVYRLPDALSFEAAAVLPVSYQTAWRALLSRARLRPGEDVLVIGASGGTAIAAIQVAKFAGARVFAVTSGAERAEQVRRIGADVVYDRRETQFSRALRQDTDGRGVDVVVENVGAPMWEGSIHSLARGGRLVTYGATAGFDVRLDLRLIFWKQLEVVGSTMASRAEFEAMLRAAFRGAFPPVIDSVLSLAAARDAHRRLEAGDQFGKILLVP